MRRAVFSAISRSFSLPLSWVAVSFVGAVQAGRVDLRAIEGFLASPLAGELRRAEQVEREFRFSLLVPAGDYYEDLSDEDQVLLQGVVDLFAVIDKTHL